MPVAQKAIGNPVEKRPRTAAAIGLAGGEILGAKLEAFAQDRLLLLEDEDALALAHELGEVKALREQVELVVEGPSPEDHCIERAEILVKIDKLELDAGSIQGFG